MNKQNKTLSKTSKLYSSTLPANLLSSTRKGNLVELLQENSEDKYLGYFTRQQVNTCITVPLDQDIREPSYYRQVISGIEELQEGDTVVFNINSNGGRMDGLESILSCISSTEANTIAVIQGSADSAASIIALHCDGVAVSPYGSMLCHFIVFGVQGAASHIKAHVDHTQKISESLFRDTYQYFLTDEEIEQCINQDRQIYLDSEQIQERLEKRVEILQALAEEDDGGCEGCSSVSRRERETCSESCGKCSAVETPGVFIEEKVTQPDPFDNTGKFYDEDETPPNTHEELDLSGTFKPKKVRKTK